MTTIDVKTQDSKRKRGDVREDGMVFWYYNPDYPNRERWVTEEEFVRLRKGDLERGRVYAAKNRQKIRDRQRKNYAKKPELYKGWARKSFHKNKDKCLDRAKCWRRKNPNYSNEYYQRNLEKMREVSRRAMAKKKLDEPVFKLICSIRSRIVKCIKHLFTGQRKNNTTIKILGCSKNEFKFYLESMFSSEMNWENHGSFWELDHIIPIASAKTYNEVIRLNHFSNFQPLKKRHNRLKRDKMPEDWKIPVDALR